MIFAFKGFANPESTEYNQFTLTIEAIAEMAQMNVGFEMLAAFMAVTNVVDGWGLFQSPGFERSKVISSTVLFLWPRAVVVGNKLFDPWSRRRALQVPGLDDKDKMQSTKATADAMAHFANMFEVLRMRKAYAGWDNLTFGQQS